MEASADAAALSPRDLQARLQKSSSPIVIHTLPAWHFERVRLPGAINACVYEVTFLDQVEKAAPDLDREIVVYGSSGRSGDSRAAAEKLSRRGYRRVSVLDGGLEAWQEAGFQVEGTPEVRPAAGPLIENRTYELDSAASFLGWTGRKASKKHFGTLDLAEGRVKVEDGTISGRFVIDMTSIKNIDLQGDEYYPILISHLSSDDFFFTKLFPRAVFTLTSAVRSSLRA